MSTRLLGLWGARRNVDPRPRSTRRPEKAVPEEPGFHAPRAQQLVHHQPHSRVTVPSPVTLYHPVAASILAEGLQT